MNTTLKTGTRRLMAALLMAVPMLLASLALGVTGDAEARSVNGKQQQLQVENEIGVSSLAGEFTCSVGVQWDSSEGAYAIVLKFGDHDGGFKVFASYGLGLIHEEIGKGEADTVLLFDDRFGGAHNVVIRLDGGPVVDCGWVSVPTCIPSGVLAPADANFCTTGPVSYPGGNAGELGSMS